MREVAVVSDAPPRTPNLVKRMEAFEEGVFLEAAANSLGIHKTALQSETVPTILQPLFTRLPGFFVEGLRFFPTTPPPASTFRDMRCMMNRCSFRRAFLVGAAIVAALAPCWGCRSVLTTAMYLIKGNDIDPDFKELKGKNVAVVCRPLVSLQYRNSNVGRDLAQQITLLLQEKVPKIKTIDQRKIGKWTDENTWEEYVEVGKAMKADMVVGVDLEAFDLYQGQTLYQGKAAGTIRVYDCQHGGKLVYEKALPPSTYPPNVGVPTSERTESQFRREFVLVLADQIARHFYAHDPYADVAQDARALAR